MENTINSSIKDFLNNVLYAGEKLSNFSNEVENKDKNIQNIIERLSSYIEHIEISENKQFDNEIKNTLNEYKEKGKVWVKRVNDYMKGKEFINQFEKSLLFVIFGNVNVGKSSLGNFIAGNDEELKKYYHNVPDYYIYDLADTDKEAVAEKMKDNIFVENFTEETSCIQYYTLNNGLTWVDSPGIHSINGKNEALAKKYVDYADMVLFIMSSASPGKYDEFKEMTRLINKKKPVLVIISKCDTKEIDEVDGNIVKKLVSKSEEVKKQQEEYVKNLFKDNKHVESIDALSLSVKLAKESLKYNDEIGFTNSGMKKFYSKIGNTLKDDVLELKMRAPKQRINGLLNEIINGSDDIEGINEMYKSFKKILNNIEEKINEIDSLEKSLAHEISVKSMPKIDIAISKISAEIQNQKDNDEADIKNLVTDIILEVFNKVINEKITKILNDFKYEKRISLDVDIDTKLKAKYDTVSYTQYDFVEHERDPKGIIENICSLFGKKYTTIKTKANTIEKKILIGDNSSDIINNILLNLEEKIQPEISNTLKNVADNYFGREKEIVSGIMNKLDEIQEDLKKEKL